jgi:hypothetical protein
MAHTHAAKANSRKLFIGSKFPVFHVQKFYGKKKAAAVLMLISKKNFSIPCLFKWNRCKSNACTKMKSPSVGEGLFLNLNKFFCWTVNVSGLVGFSLGLDQRLVFNRIRMLLFWFSISDLVFLFFLGLDNLMTQN